VRLLSTGVAGKGSTRGGLPATQPGEEDTSGRGYVGLPFPSHYLSETIGLESERILLVNGWLAVRWL
jgi:hypothetical protein